MTWKPKTRADAGASKTISTAADRGSQASITRTTTARKTIVSLTSGWRRNAIDHLANLDPKRRHLIQLGFKHPHYNLVTPDRFYQMYDVDKITWPEIAATEDYHGPQPGMAVYELAYIVNGQWTPEKAGD